MTRGAGLVTVGTTTSGTVTVEMGGAVTVVGKGGRLTLGKEGTVTAVGRDGRLTLGTEGTVTAVGNDGRLTGTVTAGAICFVGTPALPRAVMAALLRADGMVCPGALVVSGRPSALAAILGLTDPPKLTS